MRGQRTAHDTDKRRPLRSSGVLREYIKRLDGVYADLIARRDHLQAMLELRERQKANLLEIIEVEARLADLRQRLGPSAQSPPESGPTDSRRGQEVVTAS